MSRATRRKPAWARKAWEVNRLWKVCEDRGFHVRTGLIEVRLLGGKPYDMERCADCTVQITVDSPRWSVDK